MTINTCHLRPRSVGSVTLHTANPDDPPAIDPAFLTDPYDWEKSLEGFRWGREMLRSKAYQPFVVKEYLPSADVRTDAEIREYVRQWAKTDYHPVGSCKMGDDDLAVVDQELKVHGMDRPAGDRRVHHAQADQREHDGDLDDDRREGRAPRAARPYPARSHGWPGMSDRRHPRSAGSPSIVDDCWPRSARPAGQAQRADPGDARQLDAILPSSTPTARSGSWSSPAPGIGRSAPVRTSNGSRRSPRWTCGRSWTRRGHRVFDRLADLRQPTIAAVSGNAYGGGFELALACDLRVLADDATRRPDRDRNRHLAGLGRDRSTPRPWSASGRAKELIFTGEPLTAERALAWGVANQLAAKAQVIVSAATALAKIIAGQAPIAVQMAKQAIDSGDAYP